MIGVRTPGRGLLLVALALVACASLACSTDVGLHLEFAADPSIALTLTQPNEEPTESLSFGSIMLCVSAKASATITTVRLDQPQGDLRVEAFAVRSNPIPNGPALGSEQGTLTEFDPAFVPADVQHVAGVCPADPSAPTPAEATTLTELGVQVRLASGDVGGGRALDVDYQIDGQSRTLTVPFGIWLCAHACPAGVGTDATGAP